MKTANGGAFDPETIDLLRCVLDEVWDSTGRGTTPSEQEPVRRAHPKLPATGERDPVRLRTRTEVIASEAVA
jgi:hypothetical protein